MMEHESDVAGRRREARSVQGGRRRRAQAAAQRLASHPMSTLVPVAWEYFSCAGKGDRDPLWQDTGVHVSSKKQTGHW